MKSRIKARGVVFVGIVALLLNQQHGFAASDTWNQPSGTANWRDGANWTSGTQFPDGSGDVASFTNDISSAQSVTNSTAVTVGGINIGDSGGTVFNFTIGANASQIINLDNGASPISINNTAGFNVILDKLNATGANKDLNVNVATSELDFGSSSVDPVLAIHDLTKNGAGTLFLWNNNTGFTGSNIFINAGTINLDSQALPTNGVVTMRSGTTLAVGGGRAQDLAEVRGTGMIRGPGGASGRLVIGSPNANYSSITFSGVTVTNGGILRPGDTNGFGQIGTLSIGNVSPAPNPLHSEVGAQIYFDIASYTSFDQIDVPRTVSTINGGDVYISLGFTPTNGTQFRLFIDSSTQGYNDGNGGDLFDHIYAVEHANETNWWSAAIGDSPIIEGSPGPIAGRNIIFTYIPEPSAMGLFFVSAVLFLGRRRS